MTTPYDQLPIEIRRANWGWFGEPWPSGICYTDDGQLIEEMRKPAPVGEDCLYCETPITSDHSGNAIPYGTANAGPVIRHVHKECSLRQVLGSPEHLDGACMCHGGGEPRQSYREQALAVWDRFNSRASSS